MKFLVFASVIGFAASSTLQGYNLPRHGSGSFSHGVIGSSGTSEVIFGHGTTSSSTFDHGTTSGSTFGHGTTDIGSGSRTSFGQGYSLGSCGAGQVRHVDGRCITPRVNRRVFLYDVPHNVRQTSGAVNIPEPRVETNVILIRTPEGGVGQEPIVIPPPRQNNIVYVLNKQSSQDQRVIEVPSSGPQTPEVYFVNYEEGENPTLPSGVDLQTALQTASHSAGQQVGSGGHSGGSTGQSVSIGGHDFGSTDQFISFDDQIHQLSGLYTQP